MSSHILMNLVRSFFDSQLACMSDHSTSRPPDPLVKWHSIGETCTIINVDDNSFGNPGQAGFGGLIRTSDGTWLEFSGYIGVSNNHAELLALYQGLSKAMQMGLN